MSGQIKLRFFWFGKRNVPMNTLSGSGRISQILEYAFNIADLLKGNFPHNFIFRHSDFFFNRFICVRERARNVFCAHVTNFIETGYGLILFGVLIGKYTKGTM